MFLVGFFGCIVAGISGGVLLAKFENWYISRSTNRRNQGA